MTIKVWLPLDPHAGDLNRWSLIYSCDVKTVNYLLLPHHPKKQRIKTMARRTGVGIAALLAIAFLTLVVIGLSIGFVVQGSNNGAPVTIFDYVIVGGGAAGCRMAEKLSASGEFTVLVLEAGIRADEDPPILEVGPLTNELAAQYYNEYFWQCAQVPGQGIPAELTQQYTTGRLLGGSSSINGIQYVKGTDWIYDRWVALTGDPIWSPVNVMEAFKNIETYTAILGSYDPTRRGSTGRLAVLETMTTAPQTSPTTMSEKLTTAYERMLGMSRLSDYNNVTEATRLGPFTNWQLHAHADGTRSSSSTAFLSPDVMARSNLVLILAATVNKINFNDEKRAVSVSYIHNHATRIVHARQRIILCAGIFSPTILQHSGIGDAAYLASVGVSPIVYDNPGVGKVLKNQELGMSLFLKNLSDLPSANPADLYEGGAFLPTPLGPSFVEPLVSPRRIQVVGLNTGAVMMVGIINLQPQSSGFVRIRDADPLRVPASNDGIFDLTPEGEIDVELYIAAFKKYVCALANEFQGTGVGPAIDTSYVLIQPSPAQCANETLLRAFVHENVRAHPRHWTSSCKMGNTVDAVVTGKGRVIGVTGLIVADGSILPIIADGNTVAPSIMVAEVIGNEILLGNV